MYAIIRNPAPNTVSSGRSGTDKWVLEFPKNQSLSVDPLTGNTQSRDMMCEINLSFDSKKSAVAYAQKNGIAFQIFERASSAPKGRSYGENFDFDRKFPWTH